MMDIRLLTFITVGKTKSYTKAAELLNITQPAVSQHIKFLEEEYNVKLIKKSGRSLDLTEEGLILFDYAEEIKVLYSALDMRLKNKSGIIKKYNLGASMSIGGYILPYILAKYKKINENVNIFLQVNNTEEILKKLINGKLDFALIEGPFDKNKFKFKKFKDDELVLAVSANNNFAKMPEVAVEDILKGNLILREEGSGTRKIFENKLIELGFSLNDLSGCMEIGNISGIKSLIELNLGYSIISRETIKKELSQGTIKTAAIKDIKIFREFNFVYLEEDEFIDSFIDFCCENSN